VRQLPAAVPPGDRRPAGAEAAQDPQHLGMRREGGEEEIGGGENERRGEGRRKRGVGPKKQEESWWVVSGTERKAE